MSDRQIETRNVKEIKVQKRIRQDVGDVTELAESMASNGQLNPIIVEGDTLRAGMRRLAAVAWLASKDRTVGEDTKDRALPQGHVEVRQFNDLSPMERLEIEIEENTKRKQFTDAEEAIAIANIKALMEEAEGREVTTRDVAKRLKMDRSKVTMATRVADAIEKEGREELRKASSVKGAYRQLLTTERLEELQERSGEMVEEQEAAREFLRNIECADATEWIEAVDGESIDFWNFDPPWGIGIDSYDRRQKYGTFDDSAETGIQAARDIIPHLYRTLKPDTWSVVWFGIQYYEPLTRELSEAGFDVNPVPCIWYKDNKHGSQNDPHRTLLNVWEPFFVVSKGDPRMFKKAQSNHLQYPMPTGDTRLHFAQKSIPLLKDIFERYTFGGMTIGDPMFGSGSFLHAAKALGRRVIGCERDQDNYDNAVAWLKRNV